MMALSKMAKQYMIDKLNDIKMSLKDLKLMGLEAQGIPIYKGYTHFDMIMTSRDKNIIENQIEKLKDMINDE